MDIGAPVRRIVVEPEEMPTRPTRRKVAPEEPTREPTRKLPVPVPA